MIMVTDLRSAQALEKEEAERKAALAEVARLEAQVAAASKESADASRTLESVGTHCEL